MFNSSVYCKQIARLVAWDSSCAASGAAHRAKTGRQKADQDNMAQLSVKSSLVQDANMQSLELTLSFSFFLSCCDVDMQRQALAHSLFLARSRCVLGRDWRSCLKSILPIVLGNLFLQLFFQYLVCFTCSFAIVSLILFLFL